MMTSLNVPELPPELASLIPLDKTWEIRRIVLWLVNNILTVEQVSQEQEKVQEHYGPLSNDIIALYRCAVAWITEASVLNVGESGTLYRILQFLLWKEHREGRRIQPRIVKEWSLRERTVSDNHLLIDFTQSELLKFDGGTSQWATAAALAGDTGRIENPPYKLQVTYDAIDAQKSQPWKLIPPRIDQTIARQAAAFLYWRETENMIFEWEQSEDYCFMRVFDIMGLNKWKALWPKLAIQESDRLDGFEEQIRLVSSWQPITVDDHRPVAALAMRYWLWREHFMHPDAVNKSWPRFWDFMWHVNQKNSTLKHS